MSGILGQLAGAALQNMLGGAGGRGGADSPLAAILAQMMGAGGAGPQQMPGRAAPGGMGGLSDLLQQFQQAGLGGKAESWVSAGQNEPVTPGELSRVFPPGQVERWAAQVGTDPGSLLAVLSQALPHVVDRLTPDGRLPERPVAPNGAADLSQLLSGLFPQR